MLPSVSLTINPNGLRQVAASSSGVAALLGISSGGLPNTVYSIGDSGTAQAILGSGPLVENVIDALAGTSQVVAMPLTPSVAGVVGGTLAAPSAGVVAHTGGGSGTMVPSAGAAYAIDIKIVTGGALGTMVVQSRVNGGAYSNPVTSVAGSSWAYLVPGTLVVATFSSNTYTAAAVWTIATTGGITLVGTGTAGWVTAVASALDLFQVVVTMVNAGALGVATFTYSLDNGATNSGQVLVPVSTGLYALPGTGVLLTFAGTFTAGDTYSFATTTASFVTGDVVAALAVLMADPTEWGFCHVIGQGSTAAGAAALAAVVDTSMMAAEAAYRYVWGMVECPQLETDATIATAFANFVSTRTMVTVGDISHVSPISGRQIRRNCGVVVTSRLVKIRISEHPGFVGSTAGSLKGVVALYRDESKTPYLDAQRFTTLRTLVGQPGFYVTRGKMMAQDGTDYSNVMNRRVMDVACRAAYRSLIRYLNSSVQINKATGFIYDPVASEIEGLVDSDITLALADNASDVTVLVSRTENILSTHRLPITIGIVPLGYAEQIVATIGLVNPALA